MQLIKTTYLALAIALLFVGTATAADLTNPGTIHDAEVFTIHDGETLTVTYTNGLVIEAGGHLVIEPGGLLYISGSGTMEYYGDITNNGEIIVDGNAYNWEGSTLTNNGHMYLYSDYFGNWGTVENNEYIYSSTDFYNRGTIINNGKLEYETSLSNNYGNIENYGELYYMGCWSCPNMGTINNYNYLKVVAEMTNRNTGIINNFCTFENEWIIENEGTINNHQDAILNNIGHGQILGNPVNYFNSIPEFPTLALPMTAVLGLALLFRKR